MEKYRDIIRRMDALEKRMSNLDKAKKSSPIKTKTVIKKK